MSEQDTQTRKRDKKGLVALSLAGLVAAMVGLSFAAVPLYRIFCQTTGYGGATQRAEVAPTDVLDRIVTVRFDANVNPNLPWSFAPEQRTMQVHVGESGLAFFKATNNSDKPVTGTAGFNVAPQAAGLYFTKVQCFCFTAQTLQPGESIEMPVSFFVDPKFVEDESTVNIPEITLSYTFYRSDDPSDVAAAPRDGTSGS
jgi:cytochrome c oxidase assembly protein subunit 11